MKKSRRRPDLSIATVPLVLAFAWAAAAQGTASPAPAPAVASPPPVDAPPAPAAAPPARQAQPYTWASVGTTFAYGQTYGSANVGAGLLVRYGIAPNVELGYAFGNSPTLWSLRPGVTWYVPVSNVRPYLGAFYTRWFVGDGQPDQNGIGGRAGFSLGRVISLGVTYDHAFGCDRNCDSWTPMISAGLSL